MNAYDEMYLDDAMNNLGEAIEYCSSCGISPNTFMSLFISSGYADLFGNGNPSVVSGRSGTELVQDVLSKVGLKTDFPKLRFISMSTPEYWSGWSLALYQWASGRPFSKIINKISIEELMTLYHPLHEASEDKVIETIDEVIHSREKETYLQEMRKKTGMTQRKLSERSGVGIRTLQQYENGARDINKASGNILMALSKALGCKMEDLMQYPPVSLQSQLRYDLGVDHCD